MKQRLIYLFYFLIVLFSFSNVTSADLKIKSEEKQFDTTQTLVEKESSAPTSKKAGFFSTKLQKYKTFVSDLLIATTSSKSPYTLLIFIYLLGLLMSLTPCIYPMIPITIGTLQATAGQSFLKNSLRALCYVTGIATTFAIIGTLVSSGIAKFGSFLGSPIFIIFLVLFLLYLAFSMFGFYDVKIPGIVKLKSSKTSGSSFLSVFLFGLMSGTIASPCVSPGLVLILGIVARLGSTLLGGMYLFIFGLGLGTPLFLLGTFSNLIKFTPKSGIWMIEVKKIFGFLLIGVAFYYLSGILPLTTIVWAVALYLLAVAIYYHFSVSLSDSRGTRLFKKIMGALLMLTSFFVFFEAYNRTIEPPKKETICIEGDYLEVCKRCRAENKFLLLDFTASWCSSCKSLERKFFTKKELLEQIPELCILKLDCTNPQATSCAGVIRQFRVLGFPELILITPKDQSIIARWGAELLELSNKEFIELIKKALKKA